MSTNIILEMRGTSACLQSEQIEANTDCPFIPLRTGTLYPWTQETVDPSLILSQISLAISDANWTMFIK